MKRIVVLSLTAALVLGLAASAMALPFPITDVRALGMGGAFVAAGEGIGAVQHNPALLGEDTTVSVALQGTARYEDHIGLVDLIEDLDSAIAAADTTQTFALLNGLDQAGGIDINGSGGVGAGFGVFGISAGVTYSNVVYGVINPDAIDASIPGLADSTKNLLQYGALEAKQIVLSGAKSFGNIIVGANVRSLDGTFFSDTQSLLTSPDTGIGDVTSGAETSKSATAIDVGVLFGLVPMVDVGIMAKDINSPDLDFLEFKPRYRIGAAVSLPTITIAADYDITEDDEGGSRYQEWAMGAEFDIWAIALRTGLSKNTGLSGAPTLLHFGLGLGFLDFGVAYAEKGDYYMAGFNMELGF
jgi:hypothetical protein